MTTSSAVGIVSSAIAWLLLVWATSAQFVYQTAGVSQDEPAGVVAAGALVSAVALCAVFGIAKRAEIAAIPASRVALATIGGFLSFAAAPYPVLVNRHSDAPSGAIVLFLTTALWGLLLVAGSGLIDPARRSGWGLRVAAMLLATTGAAGVLANWERPSSFSLVVRFSAEQGAMALAGVIWAAGVLLVVRETRLGGTRVAATSAAVGVALGGLAALMAAGPASVASSVGSGLGLSAAVAAAASAVLLLWVAANVSVAAAAAALALAPSALSLLTIVEQAVGALGPRPMLVPEVLWASVAALAAAALAAFSEVRTCSAAPADASDEDAPDVGVSREGRALRILLSVGRILAAASAVAATVALVMPGVSVSVQGLRTDMSKFTAEFLMRGFETVGGWLALGIALVAVALLFARSRPVASVSALAFAGVVAAAAAWLSLRNIPLHTWVAWIPAEVQQDYGTEFARIQFTGISLPAQLSAIVTGLATVALAVWAALASARTDSSEATGREGDIA